ncbi:MAG TPA: 4Fe-4S binding protein, partial [Burkholderiaceae bacterium]|nr:4Fe-4S binding protein [Burkholderiaceae bacterium]
MQALQVEIERLSASDACIGCGRCVAVCPNEALEIDGLESLGAATQSAAEMVVRLECSRVPDDEDRPGTVRVPCLGAVSTGWLVQLQAHAGDRPVHVIDRGWCATCPAGGQARHP